MKGQWGRAVFLVVMVLGLFRPVVFPGDTGGGSTGPDPAQISRYDADFTVARDGRVDVVETVTTQMPEGRHGIFRFWDVVDRSDPHVRLVPHDIAVTQDGNPAAVTYSWEDGKRYRVAKIGHANELLTPGQHVYTIGYHVDGALSAGADGKAQLYWDLVPGGWAMDIGAARLSVHLPAASSSRVRCAVGFGSTGGCEVVGAGTRDLTVTTAALPARTPVTIRTGVDQAPPGRSSLPWTIRFDPVLGRSVPGLVVLLLLSALLAAAGIALTVRSREDPPGFPVLYAPPEGLGPAQAAYVVGESVPDQAMAATLMYQAERGLTRLTPTQQGGWVVTGAGTGKQWAEVDPVTRALGESMGVTSRGYEFHADRTVPSGEGLSMARSRLVSAVKDWDTQHQVLRWSTPEGVGRILVYVAMAVAFVLIWFNPFGITFLGLPPLAYALAGLGLLRDGATTRRTDTGRVLWSRAGGFKRLLATDSAEERFDFSARKDLYTAFIPWAVAFGCAKAWQRKYETETQQAAPVAPWMGGYYGTAGAFGSTTSFVDGFQSTLDSSLSAYQATQSSSSGGGGGGGFSGGGGGGGGGGGSW